jgi:hypothetical protein
MSKQLTEGWNWIVGSRKWHYFRGQWAAEGVMKSLQDLYLKDPDYFKKQPIKLPEGPYGN